jgi:hypothetical protein
MRIYSVHGKKFTDLAEAVKYMDIMKVANYLHAQRLDFIDAAVEKSDLSEANVVINYIMEKRSEN